MRYLLRPQGHGPIASLVAQSIISIEEEARKKSVMVECSKKAISGILCNHDFEYGTACREPRGTRERRISDFISTCCCPRSISRLGSWFIPRCDPGYCYLPCDA